MCPNASSVLTLSFSAGSSAVFLALLNASNFDLTLSAFGSAWVLHHLSIKYLMSSICSISLEYQFLTNTLPLMSSYVHMSSASKSTSKLLTVPRFLISAVLFVFASLGIPMSMILSSTKWNADISKTICGHNANKLPCCFLRLFVLWGLWYVRTGLWGRRTRSLTDSWLWACLAQRTPANCLLLCVFAVVVYLSFAESKSTAYC